MSSVFLNESRLVKTCFRMESRGVLIDRAYVEAALKYEHNEIRKAKEDFKTDTGHSFLDSSKLFAKIFDERGEAYPTTDKGNPSFRAEYLELLDTPTARLIQKVREHEKRAGTYYSSFLYYADSFNRIHANIRQAGTTTGRFSYSNPNLQNLPREKDPTDTVKPFVVRGSFIPTPSFIFSSIDYSQMEYRLMLDYAGEKALIEKILGGEDLHQATADLVGVSRDRAKTLNFAILYGAGIDEIARQLKVSVNQAHELRRMYFGRLPKVRNFIKRVIETGEQRGFVRNWMGRECHIRFKSEAYKLPNHLIQGGCADIIKLAMNQIDQYTLDKKMRSGLVVQVHDENLLEVHENEYDLIEKAREIMQGVYVPKNGMVLTAEADWSDKSWAKRDLKPWEGPSQSLNEEPSTSLESSSEVIGPEKTWPVLNGVYPIESGA